MQNWDAKAVEDAFATAANALGKAAATAALEAFDANQTAALLVNREGEVIRSNRSAERLLRGDVQISSKRLRSVESAATAALNRALKHLLSSSAGTAMMQPIALPRADSAPILAYPLKLPSLSLNAMAEAQAAIILVDPSHRASPPEASLRSIFRLTAAEARLASALASGESLERVCEALGISKETARTQLKSIFSKTGTHRQSELALTIKNLL